MKRFSGIKMLFLGGFVVNLYITGAFQVELHGLINAIEIVYKKNLSRL